MTTIITRLYAAEERAVAAADALKQRFQADRINLVTPKSAQGADVAALAVKSGVTKADAAVFAEKVRQGHSFVTVSAPWSFAKGAIAILEKHGPVDAGLKSTDFHYVDGRHNAAPFSALLGQSVLAKSKSSIKLSDGPAVFSDIFKLPTLSNSKSSTALKNESTPFSSLLGLSTISRSKPFSSLVKDDRSGVTLV
jgi:hypothetical protein